MHIVCTNHTECKIPYSLFELDDVEFIQFDPKSLHENSMIEQTEYMAKASKRPTAPKQARIPEPFAAAATDAARENVQSFNQFVILAVKEKLERLGRLPDLRKRTK